MKITEKKLYTYMTAHSSKDFKIQAYSIKELRAWYGVSPVTWSRWLTKIKDLGQYDGKKYTPAQVEKIVNHLGKP